MKPPDPVFWPTIVTWALILLGWYAVHLATLARERRKEKRDAASKAIESIQKLETDAIAFHKAASHDAHQSELLRYEIDRIIRLLQRSPLRSLKVPIVLMVSFRRSITLRNADPSNFESQLPGSSILRDIRGAVDDLTEFIDVAREETWN